MASNITNTSPWMGLVEHIDLHASSSGSRGIIVAALVAALLPIAVKLLNLLLGTGDDGKRRQFPLVNGPKWFEFSIQKKWDFLTRGNEVIQQARAQHGDKPFRVINEYAEVTVLPRSFAQAIRNIPALDFRTYISMRLNGHVAGFEPFLTIMHPDRLLQKIVKGRLAKLQVIEILASEASFAMNKAFGDSPEWRLVDPTPLLLDFISRMSSRVFVGAERCRDEEWLDIAKNYTTISFHATFKLNAVPEVLKPLLAALDPDCRRARAYVARARAIVDGIVAERRRAADERRELGLPPPPPFNDSIEWSEAVTQGKPHDATALQLMLSFVAIHTTNTYTSQTLLHLAENPDMIPPLREEIVEVLSREGWCKKALFHMQLLDSAIKESLRMVPIDTLILQRFAQEDVTIPGGITVRKGERVVVDYLTDKQQPSSTTGAPPHPADLPPDRYDAFRFKRVRERGGDDEHRAQLTTSLPDQLGFGYGPFACPGRFFAADQIKMALCHLLLKYDWAMAPGSSSEPLFLGTSILSNPKTRVLYRRRKEEINLDTLQVEEGGFAREA